LACDAPNAQPGFGVTFRYIIQVNRNNPPDEVFVQTAIAAALIRVEPRTVALNFVGPEDGLVARRDYTRQMQIIRFLAHDVPVALHAGELWLGLVSAARPYLSHPRGHRDRWRPPHRPWRRACLRTRHARPARRDARAAGRRRGQPHQH
jgi:hypothetical protein